MRLLEVETFGRGGLSHYAYNLSCALAERGHELTLVTAADYELAGLAELPPNVRLIRAIGRFAARPKRSEFLWRLIRRAEAVIDALKVAAVARRLRPEIIHLHCTNPIAFLYVLLFRLLRIPLAATAHVVTPHEPMRFQGFVYGSSYRLCQLLITHSEVDRRRLIDELGVNPDHLAVIPHGEYGFFERCGELPERHTARIHLGLASDAEVALFFGYIREYKGLDVLLDAWSAVLEARPRARLVIAGDPVRLDPARHGELQSRADDLGALHRFDYVPFSEVPTYFAAADTLVMPYRSISQSGVLYLALSLGVPVVATRVGALPEILRHGESALLVPPEHPDALAEALIRVLSGAALRQRLAVGGSEIARQHSWPAIAKHTETVFRRLIMD